MLHEFEDYPVKLDSETWLCSGSADVEYEDIGIGSYEYWGAKGKDSYIIPVFENISLTDWHQEGEPAEPLQGMTPEGICRLADAVADTLNEDESLKEKYLDS